MRRTTYLIDDKEGFKKQKLNENLLKTIDEFKVYYTLEESDNSEFRYCLETIDEKKLSINNLNGYQRMFIDECFKCFTNKSEISEKYKDYITILDEPREIKYSNNIRYELFKTYAEFNNIEVNTFNYINFIDKFSNEFENLYNESILNNQEKFDEFLKNKIIENEELLEDEDECL